MEMHRSRGDGGLRRRHLRMTWLVLCTVTISGRGAIWVCCLFLSYVLALRLLLLPFANHVLWSVGPFIFWLDEEEEEEEEEEEAEAEA